MRRLVIRGHRFLARQLASPNSRSQRALRALNLLPITETLPDDIFIAGYPKSGNTWFQNLVVGVLYAMDTRYLDDKLTQELVPDVHSRDYYKRFGAISCFKTHFLPQPSYRRVVHLVRDGRDVMVSYHAMQMALGESFSIEEMVKENKGVFPCAWAEHTREWLANPYGAEILRIRYEDLQGEPLSELERFCRFAGLRRSSDQLLRAIRGCSLSEMQRKEKELGWDDADWPKDKPFIRRGGVGSYKDEMPSEIIAYFERESFEVMRRMGYESHHENDE